ncbi:delta fatty acid desaturase [Stemphylium lycopersici]|uniref:Delta fatty acid desaturase n=1 Tax=Stemphylium lycopersici TaxID=183478 RepID=A0A364MZA2_STELY|nr:delta fatty acid desaturase [Stemphylium lycopersici]RAR01409.1 delta fatty acid desaturase [Stemphylium lycopersici]RAR07842.1 delta fatty acid desaturase [Stemphylium lycopersici]
MATTTARPQQPGLKRNITADSTANSVSASPFDSPVGSASNTSLSSLDEQPQKTKKPHGKLLDTYGNEFEIPDYTIKQLRDAIPKHCFERSAARGLAYVARDLASLATTFYLFHNYVTPDTVPSMALRAALWAGYTVLQGFFGTGLWVLAHECGHQAFSPSKTLNDTVGWFCHSLFLVPYFSWKISHGKHHKATGHMERDMVFVPKTREVYATRVGKLVHEISELTEETPVYTLLHSIGQQLAGWPLYLITNVTGHNHHDRQIEGKGEGKKNGWFGGVNHFNPSSPLYEKRDEKLILLSDLGIALVIAALTWVGKSYGFNNLLVWYIIPYLWVNHWLVMITFLQHTDPTLPHYDAETWTYTRGAAATIDREFGFIGRHLLHGIVETHVLHHYISTIPFYHADEATEAIKPIMGRHYRSDTKDGPIGFLKALWKSARWCQWVEPSVGAEGEGKGVLFFRNHNGLGTPPQKIDASASTKGAKMEVGPESDNE